MRIQEPARLIDVVRSADVVVAGGGIAGSGFIFPGVGVLGISLIGFALAILLFLALIAYCRYVLPTAIRGICHATGVVIKSISGRR